MQLSRCDIKSKITDFLKVLHSSGWKDHESYWHYFAHVVICSSPLKPLSQMEPNLAGMIIRWNSTKFLFLLPVSNSPLLLATSTPSHLFSFVFFLKGNNSIKEKWKHSISGNQMSLPNKNKSWFDNLLQLFPRRLHPPLFLKSGIKTSREVQRTLYPANDLSI